MKEIKEKSEASSKESSRIKAFASFNNPQHTSPSYESVKSVESDEDNKNIKIRNDNSKVTKRKKSKKKKTKTATIKIESTL